jgi:predicted nucleic acid-binding protein
MHSLKRNRRSSRKIDLSELAEIFSIPNLHLVSLLHSFLADALAGESIPLLSNDAMHVITMKYAALDNIASGDSDFEGIKHITVWKP